MRDRTQGRNVTAALLIDLAPLEGVHLRGLISQFVALLDEADADPAGERLTPTAYPDDSDATAEYRASTREHLLDRRRKDAAVVDAALAEFTGDLDPASPDAIRAAVVAIPVAEEGAWMRTLAAMRLVVATRLGIGSEDDHDPADPSFHVYDWLGYRLDELIRLADERDAMASGS